MIWLDEKYLTYLRKLFKYQPSGWLRDDENCFSETKEFFKWNKN